MGSKACDEAIRGDLGWWTLKGRRDYARLRFWHKVVNAPENSLLKRTYRACKAVLVSVPLSWCWSTHKLLVDLNLAHVWNSEVTGSATDWRNLIRNCIHQKEVEKWNLGILNKPKLRLYRILKMNFGREVYLKLPYEQRTLIAEMRCGTNRLRIDMGRRWGEEVQNRICLVCGSGQVEDERHLLLHCEEYSDLRTRMYSRVASATRRQFDLMVDEDQWLLEALIGCGVGQIENRIRSYKAVAAFIHAALKIRARWLDTWKT